MRTGQGLRTGALIVLSILASLLTFGIILVVAGIAASQLTACRPGIVTRTVDGTTSATVECTR